MSLQALPLPARAANALWSYGQYLAKTIWPAHLTLFYQMEARTLGLTLACLGLIAGITIWCLIRLRERPYLAVGWFWFLGTLVPVIGLVQVGAQAMADRYTYIPLIGIFISAAWYLGAGQRRLIGAFAVLALCLWRTSAQLPYWHDSLALFQHAEKYAGASATVQLNLGLAYSENGKTNEAIAHYQQAIALEPSLMKAHYNLGLEYAEAGRLKESIHEFSEAVRLQPEDPYIRNNLGTILARDGNLKEAAAQFTEAVRVDPDYVRGRFNLAVTLEKEGLIAEALTEYRKAASLAPNWAEPLEKISWIFATSPDLAFKNPREAMVLAEKAKALRAQPNPITLELLAACQAELKHLPEAISLIEQAITLSGTERKKRLEETLAKYRSAGPPP